MNFMRLARALLDNRSRSPLLLIYQMGKVASQTIEATLRKANLPKPLYRTHFLSPHAIYAFREQLNNKALPQDAKDSLRRQLKEASTLYHIVNARLIWQKRGWRVPKLELIVGVREPVGLMLATIFQNYATFFSSLNDITPEACRDLFLDAPTVLEDRRRYMTTAFAAVNNWFDVELKPMAGIDVYATPFPWEKGYAVFESRHARALVYRFENLDSAKPMLEEFLQCELPLLINQNIGDKKDYGETYQMVKERLRLPPEYLEKAYATQMVRHFYSERERQQLKAHWTSGARFRSHNSSA